MNKTSVICLPYAGGSKFSYREFSKHAPPELAFVPVEYAGRGLRASESLETNMQIIASDVYGQIKSIISKNNYILYGHSMGGLVGFELLHKIIACADRLPLCFIATGCTGPSSTARKEKNWHQLSEAGFIEKIKELKGCPDEVFESEELLAYLMPIIRSDFKAVETYNYEKRSSLALPVTVITGDEEEIEEEDIALWQKDFASKIEFIKMQGDHFFILEHTQKIINIILSKLGRLYGE